jgi:hypothetical protein
MFLLLITGLGALPALAAQPAATQPDVSTEIQSLRTRLDQLEARQQPAATTQSIATTQPAAAAPVPAASPVTAGYQPGQGFFIKSADDRFLLQPWIQLQLRNDTNWRQHAKANGANDTQNGFEVRNAKIGFDGHLFTPDLTYRVDLAANRKTGDPALEEAWARYHLSSLPIALRIGQIKDPVDHEQLVGSGSQLAVDRSLVADFFVKGSDYIQAATIAYDAGPQSPLRAEGGITDGMGSNNTNFQDFPASGIPADFGFAGRVEYKAFGNWKDYSHFSSQGNKADLLVFGLGADLTEAGHSNALTYVADAQWNVGPFGLYGAYLGRAIDHNTAAVGFTGAGPSTTDQTLRGQVSYLFAPKWEAYGRYEFIHFDGKEFNPAAKNDISIITAGVNWYIHGDNLKLTVDAMYLPNGSPVADDGSGILSNGRAEVVGRVQVQLLL